KRLPSHLYMLGSRQTKVFWRTAPSQKAVPLTFSDTVSDAVSDTVSGRVFKAFCAAVHRRLLSGKQSVSEEHNQSTKTISQLKSVN
ncbi:MAG: hypothetical protein AAFP07_19685, partial [Cyanobacteria bacterium J06606_4]